MRGLRQARREANRRHQRSPEGRLDHRDRQRAYRARRRERVTDNSSPPRADSGSIAAVPLPALEDAVDRVDAAPEGMHESRSPARPSRSRAPAMGRCIVCGREGRPINPYVGWR